MNESHDKLLSLRGLSIERDHRLLASNLDLDLQAGEIVQIEGANGSGKTSLLRVLAGLSSHYQGDILWRGEPAKRATMAAEMLYLGHGAAIKSVLTPRENLRWYQAMALQPVDEAVIESALEKVGLRGFEDSHCHNLSAGQQRRVSLARLFLLDAALWILDEPFTAIDREGVAELEEWIDQRAQQGGAVLLTTHHNLKLASPYRRLRLEHGELCGVPT